MTVQDYHPRIPDPAVCRARVAQLTPAEWENLELLAAGYTVKEAFRARHVAERTFRNQLNTAFQRLDVQRLAQAFAVIRRAELEVMV